MSGAIEHDPLDLDCKCARCVRIDAVWAASEELAAQEEREEEKRAAQIKYFEFLETHKSFWKKQIEVATELNLLKVVEYIKSQLTEYCEECGVDILVRKRRSVRIPLCNRHKLEHDVWKAKRDSAIYRVSSGKQEQVFVKAPKGIRSRTAHGILYGVAHPAPRKKGRGALQEKKNRKRIVKQKEVQTTSGKPAILKAENIQDDKPHEQYVS